MARSVVLVENRSNGGFLLLFSGGCRLLCRQYHLDGHSRRRLIRSLGEELLIIGEAKEEREGLYGPHGCCRVLSG